MYRVGLESSCSNLSESKTDVVTNFLNKGFFKCHEMLVRVTRGGKEDHFYFHLLHFPASGCFYCGR